MGLVSRHANAPFANGETLSGTELESDFATIYDEYNGSIDNSNIASGAAIVGTKLASATLANSLFIADTITTSKMAASAVPKHHVAVDTSFGAVTTSQATLIAFAGLTSATLTPGSTNDLILMDLTFSYSASANDTSNDLIIGWSVDAAETNDVIASEPVLASGNIVVHSTFAATPADTNSTVMLPMHRYNGTATLTINYLVFRCFILPGK